MYVIIKEFGRVKKSINFVYFIEYFGRFEIQLSKVYLKNKSMVIYIKNNFNIIIWKKKMLYDYDRERRIYFLNVYNLKSLE